MFGIYFVADAHDLNDTSGIMKSVAHEWKHLASAATEEEVAMAKNQFRTNLYQNLETNTQKAGFNAKEVCYSAENAMDSYFIIFSFFTPEISDSCQNLKLKFKRLTLELSARLFQDMCTIVILLLSELVSSFPLAVVFTL